MTPRRYRVGRRGVSAVVLVADLGQRVPLAAGLSRRSVVPSVGSGCLGTDGTPSVIICPWNRPDIGTSDDDDRQAVCVAGPARAVGLWLHLLGFRVPVDLK